METLSNFTATKGGVMAAHPSYTDDLTVWNMTSKFGPVAKNTFVSITDQPAITSHTGFNTKKLYYFHSFGNTDRYMISVEQPMQLNFKELITSGIKNKSFYECFDWDENFENIFHILDRTTNKIISIKSNLKFFFFHTINSFEDDQKIYIDLCGYDKNSIIDDFYIDNLSTDGIPDEHKASLRRITIDLKSESVTSEDYGINMELPNINDSQRNHRYRYAYGVHSPQSNKKLAARIIKFDHKDNSHTLWGKDHLNVGEPIFVPNPQAKQEDDGVLIVLCHNEKTTKSGTCGARCKRATNSCILRRTSVYSTGITWLVLQDSQSQFCCEIVNISKFF